VAGFREGQVGTGRDIDLALPKATAFFVTGFAIGTDWPDLSCRPSRLMLNEPTRLFGLTYRFTS
jgi:hypothetical protein